MKSLRTPRRRPPAVSLILCVKNGMPYVADAVASTLAQTFADIELVVQDGGSTDGTLEWLQSIDDARVLVRSEADSGVGDACNRAIRRSRGDVVGSIDADNLLEPDAVERAVELLAKSGAGAVYGAVRIVGEDGETIETFVPGPFELLRVLECELVPPFSTAFFSRRACGRELRFDRSLRTCADFDLWLRLAHLRIDRSENVLGATRLSAKSMTRDARNYEQFCRDKAAAAERYLRRLPQNPLTGAVRRRALAGIQLWAAESVWALEGESTRFTSFLERAAEADAGSSRLQRIREMVASQRVT